MCFIAHHRDLRGPHSRTTLYTHQGMLHTYTRTHIYALTRKRANRSVERHIRGYIEELASANHAPISRRARHFLGSRSGLGLVIFRLFVYVSAAIRFLRFVRSPTRGCTYVCVCVYISVVSRAGAADDVDYGKYCYARRCIVRANSSETRRTNHNKHIDFCETLDPCG